MNLGISPRRRVVYTGYFPQYGESVSLAVIQEDGQSELSAVSQNCGSLGKIGPKIRKTVAFSGRLSVSYELCFSKTFHFTQTKQVHVSFNTNCSLILL